MSLKLKNIKIYILYVFVISYFLSQNNIHQFITSPSSSLFRAQVFFYIKKNNVKCRVLSPHVSFFQHDSIIKHGIYNVISDSGQVSNMCSSLLFSFLHFSNHIFFNKKNMFVIAVASGQIINMFFIIINTSIRTTLRVPRLISLTMKLMII